MGRVRFRLFYGCRDSSFPEWPADHCHALVLVQLCCIHVRAPLCDVSLTAAHTGFPEEVVAAGVEALTQILTQHSRSAFGAEQAQQLVDPCRGLLSRPMRREVVHQRVNALIAEIQLARQHQKALLKAGYALIHDRPEAKLLKASTGAGVSNTLALVSEVSDVQRFPDGEHVASFWA